MTNASQIEETAARWLVRQDGEHWTEEEADELAAWLDGDMAHKAAFWRLRHGWREADRIVALGNTSGESRPRQWRLSRYIPLSHGYAVGALAASFALFVAMGNYGLHELPGRGAGASPQLVGTPVGGQRTISLGDGSRIKLNTATVVRTTVRSEDREVWLDRGEAFFDIAHREDRPFVVHAGSRTVTVLGTRFTVRREGDKVTVAVLSGRVRVEDASAAAGTRDAVIGQGDIAFAQPHGTLITIAAPRRVDAMTGWRNGILVFDNQRLIDAVADFNRYNVRPIRIEDPAIANLRIGGTFQIANSDGFLKLLQSAYGLRVREKTDGIFVEPE